MYWTSLTIYWTGLCLGLILHSAHAQFNFNLGDIFGRNNNRGNNNNNQGNNNNRGRPDAGAILGGILGAVTNPNQNNGGLGGILNEVVAGAIENTDVKVGFENGQIQLNVQPKDQVLGPDDECVSNGAGSGSVGIRSGVGSGDCECWVRDTDFQGGDLRIGNNPSRVKNAQECQKSCQTTQGCTHWSFERRRRGARESQCWRKGQGFRRTSNRERISGPARCETQTSPATSRPAPSCRTNGGSDAGVQCVFPFTYKEVTYNGCILVDADDGKPWCSTLTDNTGQHVGGQGKWGHCPSSCPRDSGNSGTSSQPVVSVEGGTQSQLNKVQSQLPWFPADGQLAIPATSVGANNIEGVTANDINNRFLALGLNQPNNAFQQCRAPGNGPGSCRHLHHCLQPVFANFFTFIAHLCLIQGRYIGVCCPEAQTTIAPTPPPPTTNTPTPPPTRPPPPPSPITSTSAPLRQCGVNAKRFQTRIVGGRPADPDEWPWLAALVHRTGGGSGQYCGATLISDTHVLTAAHCIKPFQMEDIKVRLGEYDFEEVGETLDQTFTLSSMKIHEQYNDVTFENDIAMLKLNGVATLSRSIWPICLPAPSETFTNRRAFVIGWGTIYFGGPTSNTLQEVNVRVWDNQECAKNYRELNRNVVDTMLCAGETKRDSCQGDSGGPLNCLNSRTRRWELCGVVSWGAKCAEPEFPGVYTRVTEYLDWIQDNSV